MKHLVIIGGGFSGFWSAMSALRQSREMGKADELKITVINKDSYLINRPRLYEANLDTVRIDLQPLLQPLGIDLVTGMVTGIQPETQTVAIKKAGEDLTIHYDYLIVAAGSRLKQPEIPGRHLIHDVDQFESATNLHRHIEQLAAGNFAEEGAKNVVVVGAGLTGLEVVTGLQEIAAKYTTGKLRIILIDRQPNFGAGYSDEAREYINEVLMDHSIELRPGTLPVKVDEHFAYLSNGEKIATRTVIWTAGLEASPLNDFLSGNKDNMNRLEVDQHFKLPAYNNIIVTGDAALSRPHEDAYAVMSCQFSLPQGKWSGHNAVADIFGGEKLSYKQSTYVTCVDLGPERAMFTRGWDRKLELKESVGKKLKTEINTLWIVPSANPEDNVSASAPADPAF